MKATEREVPSTRRRGISWLLVWGSLIYMEAGAYNSVDQDVATVTKENGELALRTKYDFLVERGVTGQVWRNFRIDRGIRR